MEVHLAETDDVLTYFVAARELLKLVLDSDVLTADEKWELGTAFDTVERVEQFVLVRSKDHA